MILDPRLAYIDRELCAPHRPDGLWQFVQLAWDQVDPQPLVAETYMQVVCEHLQKVWKRELPNLLENIPPGMSKSLLTGVFWPAWVWGPAGDPKHRWGFASYDQRLVLRDARKARQLIESAWYQARWPLELLKDSNAQGEYTNEHNGYRVSATVRGGITGRHVDTFVIDDPQKPLGLGLASLEEEASEARIARDWYRETLPTRFSDHNTSRKVVVMQRLSANDLSQYILDSDEEYYHLLLPMWYDPARACDADWRQAKGELLAPKRYQGEAVNRLLAGMGNDPRTIAAQLQQDPAPAEGVFFRAEHFGSPWHSVEELPRSGVWGISLDCATKGKVASDRYAMQMWLRHHSHRYLLRAHTCRGEFAEALAECHAFAQMCSAWAKEQYRLGRQWTASEFVIEDKANGPAAISMLNTMGITNHTGLQVTEFNPGSQSKMDRAAAVRPLFTSGLVHHNPSEHADWLAELKAFPGGRYDDQVDATSQMLIYWNDGSEATDELLAQAAKIAARMGFRK